MAVQLQLLGLPRLLVHGRTVAVSWPRRSLALLTYLFTSRGAVPRDTAAFALWPDDDEESARANLRRNLNQLRGVLPEEAAAWIVADAGSIEFRHADADTDVAAFENAQSRPDAVREAVGIYGGDFASPLDDHWVISERERLRARFHALLTELVGIEFSARRFEDALTYARRIATDEPFREDIARRIISIRYAMGDRPGALAEFDRFSRSLRTEMNIDPMPETYGLRELVLRGEPLPYAPDATFAAAAGGSARTPLLPFTGRQAALERLTAAWAAASSGEGTAVFVSGEAGIGKTRLLAEFLERVVGTSARILRGTTASPEARPYEALLLALGQAAPFIGSLKLEPVWLAALASLVPEIGARRPALPAGPTLPADREVTRLFEAFARFVIAVARGRAVALVLEDLHWSGSGTFDAVRYLASRLYGHPILLIVTYRAGESSAAEQVALELCASRHAVSVALPRFKPAETLELLAAAESPLTGQPAAELVLRSEGHPLFLTELMRDYPRTRDVVGGGIVELVHARLRLCSAEAQTLARVAAVCGSTFDLDLLQRVVGWDDGALIDRLAELLARQFIRSTAVHERGTYAFSHALVRGAVIGAADPDERRRIHRIAARVLEARASGARYDVEIARHWDQAGKPQRAAEAYLRAADASLAVHARDEAASHATCGLELTTDPATQRALLKSRIVANLRRVPAPELRLDAARLRTICSGLHDVARYDAALLAFRVEEIGGTIESRNSAARALRAFLGGESPDPLRLAQIADADASNAMARGGFAETLELAAEARRRYALAGETRDDLRLAIVIANVRARLGEYPAALTDLVEIESRIAALGDPALAMDYWYLRTAVPHAQRDAAATRDAAQQLEDLARTAGDRLMEGHALVMKATAYQHASALTATLRTLDRAEEIYTSIGAWLPQRTLRNNRASVLFQIGRIEESAALLRDLYDEGKRTGATETIYYAASNLGCALLAAGRIDEALACEREALELARAMGSERFAALALGDLGAAEIAAGRRPAGLAHLLEAAELNGRLNRPAVQAHDFARAAGAQPSAERGAANARNALAIVESNPEAVALAPEILSRCAEAFERAGDASAAAYCRRRGRLILEQRLASIEGDDRQSYRNLPWHRQLVDEAGRPASDFAVS